MKRFTKYFGTPMWADLEMKKKSLKSLSSMESQSSSDDDDDEEMSAFQQTGNFLSDTNVMGRSNAESRLGNGNPCER